MKSSNPIRKFGLKLRSLREDHELSMDEFCSRYNAKYGTKLNKSTLSRYENMTQEPMVSTVKRFADFFNVDVAEFIDDEASNSENDFHESLGILPLPPMKRVPLIGTIACGNPILAVELHEETVEMPEDIHADFALRCRGDSMIDARIYDGDLVYIRRQPIVENGQIAAVLIDEEVTLKRVYISPDRILLQPENNMYQPLIYVGKEMQQIRILGLAVAFLSGVR